VNSAEAEQRYHITPLPEPPAGAYDAIILAVAHREFAALGSAGIRRFGRPGAILFDVKHILPAVEVDGRL
jgi:UDP-N-acetyl-D-galactosamine dehydrogenase